MAERGSGQALRVERCCSLVASAFSDGRCETARLISGEHRAFSMNRSRTEVYVPYPAVESGWTPRSWTCGIALQCAPSKSLIELFTLQALSDRQRLALSWVEGGVAMGWAVGRWPGLIPEFRRLVPLLEGQSLDLTGEEILDLFIGDLSYHTLTPGLTEEPTKAIHQAIQTPTDHTKRGAFIKDNRQREPRIYLRQQQFHGASSDMQTPHLIPP